MAKEGRRSPSNTKGASGTGKSTPRMDQPFDHWLHKQLHQMYDAIAQEPLPIELVQLIDRDAGTESKSHADKDLAASDKKHDKS